MKYLLALALASVALPAQAMVELVFNIDLEPEYFVYDPWVHSNDGPIDPEVPNHSEFDLVLNVNVVGPDPAVLGPPLPYTQRGRFWIGLYEKHRGSDTSNVYSSVGTIEFFGASSNLPQGPQSVTGVAGWYGLVLFELVDTELGVRDQEFSFTGFQIKAHVITTTPHKPDVFYSYSIAYLPYVEPVPKIPEPAAWVLLVAGFGLVGTALRASSKVHSSTRRRGA